MADDHCWGRDPNDWAGQSALPNGNDVQAGDKITDTVSFADLFSINYGTDGPLVDTVAPIDELSSTARTGSRVLLNATGDDVLLKVNTDFPIVGYVTIAAVETRVIRVSGQPGQW